MAPTILCIDDDYSTYATIEDGLGSEGYQLLYTDEPGDVPALIEEYQPDLLVMEILLAKGDGLELLETVTGGDADAPAVSVIVVTRAARSPVLYSRAVELGVKDYLVKPVLDSQLLSTVREFSEPESEDVDVVSASSPELPELSAEGSLSDLPLGELLQGLHANGASGALILESGKRRAGVHFRNGSPVAVSSSREPEKIEDYLLRTEQITSEQHKELTDQVAFGMGSVREVLMGMDALSDAGLDAAEAALAEDQLFALFDWSEGKYRFHEGKGLKSATAATLKSSLPSLLWRGAFEHMKDERIRALLRQRSDLYPIGCECPEELVGAAKLTRAQKNFVESMDGENTLAGFLKQGMIPDRLLYAMTLVGWIVLESEPVMTLDEVISMGQVPERESDVEEEEDASAGAPQWGQQVETAQQEKAAAPAESGAERPRIAGGLALTTQLNKARRQRKTVMAAKRKSSGKEEKPAESDPDAATRGLEAESWFRKGEGFLRKKDYAQAVEAYGMASHLDPKEGTYVAHLGWALYLSKPDNKLVRREALEQIATGIKLSPQRELPYVYLGRVFKATGEQESAEKMFRRALKIKPDCREALQELRLISLRDQKNKSLLGRLRKK